MTPKRTSIAIKKYKAYKYLKQLVETWFEDVGNEDAGIVDQMYKTITKLNKMEKCRGRTY